MKKLQFDSCCEGYQPTNQQKTEFLIVTLGKLPVWDVERYMKQLEEMKKKNPK